MNRKFILIVLLLGACFAFTVLQAATGEAQQCDLGPACVENCCGQCDPNPACVMDNPNAIPCCSAGTDNKDAHPPECPEGTECGPGPEEGLTSSSESSLLVPSGKVIRERGSVEYLKIDGLYCEKHVAECKAMDDPNASPGTRLLTKKRAAIQHKNKIMGEKSRK